MSDKSASDLTDPDNWVGGFYELALELGPADDARLEIALSTLCAQSGAQGWFGHGTGQQPIDQQRVPCTLESLTQSGHLRGVLQLPDGGRLVCGLVAVREQDGSATYQPDWVCFYIPLGSLGRSDSRVGAYPFGDIEDSLDWRRPIDDWLGDLGMRVFERVPFRLGLIGAEASGEVYSNELTAGVPTDRYFGYLIPVGNELRYYPATK